MSQGELYERYFADESILDQHERFSSEAEMLDYVRYQIAEHYPEDTDQAEAIAGRLWSSISTAPARLLRSLRPEADREN